MSATVELRAFPLERSPLPFARSTWFRWERTGVIPALLRIGGKTLIQATTIEALIDGKIVPPPNAGRINPPQRQDGARGGRPRKHPLKTPKPKQQPSAAAAE
jgi:hypothetical protein